MKQRCIRIALIALITLTMSSPVHGDDEPHDFLERMRQLITEDLRTRELEPSKRREAIHAYNAALKEVVPNLDIANADQKKRELILEQFAKYIKLCNLVPASERRVREWKKHIKKGFHYATAAEPTFSMQETEKITDHMERYLNRFSMLLWRKLHQVDEIAVSKSGWLTIKKAYKQMTSTNLIIGGEGNKQKKQWQKLTVENEDLSCEYVRLYIYTQSMRSLCNRVGTNERLFSNLFTQALFVNHFNRKQKKVLIKGNGIDRKIGIQLDALTSDKRFQWTMGVRWQGYFQAIGFAEKKVGREVSKDLKTERKWMVFQKSK